MSSPTLSRRQMLAGAGAAAAGVVLGACGSNASSATPNPTKKGGTSKTLSFRSRPDLKPPVVDVTRSGPSIPGYEFVSPTGPIILDGAGNPVWVHPVPKASTNFRVQRYQGEPVLTWWQGTVTKWGTGIGVGIIMDSRYRKVATVRCGNGLSADLHEFLLTDKGTAYLTAFEVVDADLSEVGGPEAGKLLNSYVQEVDVATGDVLFEWDSNKHIALSETKSVWTTGPNTATPFSAVHLNSVDVMSDGSLLISARNTWALYKVDPSTGAILWRLGGGLSDFTLGPGVAFAWQHDAVQYANGKISLFDDESTPPVRKQSRALFLNVDESTMDVTVTREYVHRHPSLLAGSQGSVQLLANGDVFVGWGSEPYYTRFSAKGKMLVDGKFAMGTSYRAYHDTWTGRPTGRPSIAVERTSGGLRVYASWNGATEVATWEVMGGHGPKQLSRAGSARRRGFETAVQIRSTPSWVAVRARDATGHVLGVSEAHRVPS